MMVQYKHASYSKNASTVVNHSLNWRIRFCFVVILVEGLRLESKAKYQRKRRKLINNGVLISNENKQVGTTFLSKHAHLDYKKEYKSINNEMKRLGLVSCNIGVEDND